MPTIDRGHKQARQLCRERAMAKLAHLFPREFEKLMRYEMRKAGVMGSPKFRGQLTDPLPCKLGPDGRIVWTD